MNNEFIKIYADFLKKFLKPQKKLKIVFDCSNGTAGLIIKKFRIKNLELRIINGSPDGNFPAHGPNPLDKNAFSQLQKEVIKQKADLGIIFDADADRVFFTDNKSRIINPEIIGLLLIWYFHPRRIIIGPSVGWTIKNLKNIKIINSKTGHSHIKKLMRKRKADLGFECSGHYYFSFKINKEKIYYDSGIFTAIQIINILSKLPYSLADFIDLSPKYFRSPEINIKIKNSEKILKKIENYYNSKSKSYKLKAKSYLDGLTMEFENFWFNLRPSNTEPLLRLNIEAASKSELDKFIKKLNSLIRTFVKN